MSSMEYDLDNYFMKPKKMSNGMLLYPIKLYDWEEFNRLASKFIILDIKSLNNSNRQQFQKMKKMGQIKKGQKYVNLKQDNLFDYIIDLIKDNYKEISLINTVKIQLQNSSEEDINSIKNNFKDNNYMLSIINLSLNENIDTLPNLYDDFCKLLKIITKAKKIFIDYKGENVHIKNDDSDFILNKNNFYEFRSIVMNQNLLYEPIVTPDLMSQKYIDIDMKRKFGNDEIDLESVVAFVSINTGKDVSEYTYYRLKADSSMIQRIMNYQIIFNYKANGCTEKNGGELQPPNLFEHLPIKDNPYSNTFKKYNPNSKLDQATK